MCLFCWEPRDLLLDNYYGHLVSWFDVSRDFTDSCLNYSVFSPSCQNESQLTPDCSMVAQDCANVIQRSYRGHTEVIQKWNQIVNCQDSNDIPSVTFSSAEMPSLFCTLPLVALFRSTHFSSIPSTNFFRSHFQETFLSAFFGWQPFFLFLLAIPPPSPPDWLQTLLRYERPTEVVNVFDLSKSEVKHSGSKSVSVQTVCFSHVVRFLNFSPQPFYSRFHSETDIYLIDIEIKR